MRQKYDTALGQIVPVSLKVRLTGMPKSINKGTIESGNPFGSTVEYSCTRYEEEQEGVITTLIDIMMPDRYIWNGTNYYQDYSSMLD